MRRWLFILLISCFTCPVTAQEYKYKDLVLLLPDASPHEQIAMLWDYLTYEPNEPNADFRLGKLHYDIFRKTDPLIEYKSAMAHAQQASNRLFRSTIIVTESEVRRNNEYYAPIFNAFDSKGRPYVEFLIVQNKIQVAYDSVMQFQSHMPAIYNAFTKSVNQYGNAVQIFSQINNKYKTLEDMLLLFDDAMGEELKKLKTAYDSSIYYFDQYIALTRAYPLAQYSQQYHIKPIVVYHLDGLTTGLNFLQPEVGLWNYGAWVDEFHKIYKDEIVPLRNKLDQNEAAVAGRLRDLAQSKELNPEFYSIDKDLVFNLNKYDKNSLPLGLLKYKAFRQHWIARENTIGSDTTVEKKLELYSVLIRQNRTADSLHANLEQLLNPLSLQKHHAFLTKHYGGERGLKTFVEGEERSIATTFTQYRDTLRENLLVYSQPAPASERSIKLGGYQVPLSVHSGPVDHAAVMAPVTLRQTKNPDGSVYLGGLHKMNKKNPNVMVFVARVNPDGKTGWLKEYNLPPDSTTVTFTSYLGDIVATQDGCAAVITSSDTTGRIGNTFVFINDHGVETIHRLPEQKMARKLLYQERSNSFIMVFKGKEQSQNFREDEMISAISINILGDLNWRRDISLSGTIENVVAVRDGYVLAGNYTSMKDTSGKTFNTKAALGQSNPYLVKLGLDGGIASINPISTPKSIFVDKVIKVNDESINLLGHEGAFDKVDSGGDVVHMMTDYNLKKICADF